MTPEKFEEIFEKVKDSPQAITFLRKLAYNNAGKGQLALQRTKDEAASTLLEEINQERKHLAKLGKIKNYKLPTTIKDSPFDLPENWCCPILLGIFFRNSINATTKENLKRIVAAYYIATKDIYQAKNPITTMVSIYHLQKTV